MVIVEDATLTQGDIRLTLDTAEARVAEMQAEIGDRSVRAPFAGVLHHVADGVLQLDGPQLSVRLWGVNASLHSGAALVKGQVLGAVSGLLAAGRAQ